MAALAAHDLPFNVQDNRPQLDAEVVYVDPKLATLWLSRNLRNRNLKRSKIEQFARDMAAGNWQMTGEAIKFSREGLLLDGQNRLHAIVQSGATVPLLVIRGLNDSVQGVMDTGSPRTGADALAMLGVEQAKDVSAVAGTYILWQSGFYRHCMVQSNARGRATHSEMVEAVRLRPEIIDSARFGKSLQGTLPLPVGALGLAHLLFVDVDADAAAAYFDAIANLKTRGKGDPIHTLLKRVSETRARRERVWPATALYFLMRSWNAYRSGEELAKFQLGSDTRGWAPIPIPR